MQDADVYMGFMDWVHSLRQGTTRGCDVEIITQNANDNGLQNYGSV